MWKRDYRDILSGTGLAVIGLYVGLFASASYRTGSLGQMGPGMFPSILGYVLAGLGIAIVLPALARRGASIPFEFRPALAIMGSIAGFALTVDRAGIVPALVVLTFVAALADGRPRIVQLTVLAALLAGLIVIIFRVLLGIPMPMFRWPF